MSREGRSDHLPEGIDKPRPHVQRTVPILERWDDKQRVREAPLSIS